jgi:hypothetical protein
MARGRPAVDPSDRAQHLAFGSGATIADFDVMLEIRTSDD